MSTPDLKVPELLELSPCFILWMIVIMAIILVSPYPIAFSIFALTSLLVGECFGNDTFSNNVPLLDSLLYITHGLALSYPNLKAVNFHHPGALVGYILPCKFKYHTTVHVKDIWAGITRTFKFAPYATLSDLRKQINNKLIIQSSLYWLSCNGKPLRDCFKLENLEGAVEMNGFMWGHALLYQRLHQWSRIQKIWQYGGKIWAKVRCRNA